MPYYVYVSDRVAFYTETASEITARTECARFIAIDVMRRFDTPLPDFTIRDHHFLSSIHDYFDRGTLKGLIKTCEDCECMTNVYSLDAYTKPDSSKEEAREFYHCDVDQWFRKYIQKVGMVVEQRMKETKLDLEVAEDTLKECDRMIIEQAEQAIERAMRVMKRQRSSE